jgi:hypothetical protein
MMMNPPEAAQHSRTTTTEKSRLLHSYMAFRAARDQQPHDLSVAYYRTYITQGITRIQPGLRSTPVVQPQSP